MSRPFSEVTGKPGSVRGKFAKSRLAGERDPAVLARLRDPRIKASRETIAKSLLGHWRQEHLMVLRMAWETRAHYLGHIGQIEMEIHRRTTQIQDAASTTGEDAQTGPEARPEACAPVVKKRGKSKNQPAQGESLRTHYQRIFGSDLTRIPAIDVPTVQALLSEVGPALGAFPTEAAFASWAGLCPGTKISGGRRLGSRSRQGKPRIAMMLRQSALGLHRSQTALGQRYRRLRTRLGAPKALTAMAHLLLRIICKLVRSGLEYDDSIYAKMETEHREHRIKHLQSTAKSFGFTLIPTTPTDPQPEALAK